MDFNSYYINQANGYPVFRGASFQRGYGLGNVFRRFMSWAIPLFKEYGLPLVKSMGKEIVTNAASVANDAIEGKNIKESAKEKIIDSLEKLKQQKGSGLKKKTSNLNKKSEEQKTKTKKRRKKQKQKSNKKRKLDIFDKTII